MKKKLYQLHKAKYLRSRLYRFQREAFNAINNLFATCVMEFYSNI